MTTIDVAATPADDGSAGADRTRALDSPTIARAFLHTIARRGTAIALRTQDGSPEIRFDELFERMRTVAGALAAHGVSRGDTVSRMMTNRPEFNVIDGAAMLMGAAPFSVYNTAPPEQLDYTIGNADARIVFAESQFADVLARTAQHGLHIERLVVIDDDASWSTFLGSARDFDLHTAAASVEPEDLVTLIYTSGTTGPPKGVQLTHANMLALLRSLDAAWPMLASAMGGQVVSFLPHRAHRGPADVALRRTDGLRREGHHGAGAR